VTEKNIHEGMPEVEARFAALRSSEMEWRNNKPDDFNVDREWVNKTRYEMQIKKECLVLSIADSAAYKREPVVTLEHLNYAEHFQQEINRADEANGNDYSQATDALIDALFDYCDTQLDSKNSKSKTYFGKHTKGDRQARRIKVAELANATGKHKRIATQLAAESGIKDKTSTHFVRACLKDGVTKGYWKHIREDKTRKGLKEEHLIVSHRE